MAISPARASDQRLWPEAGLVDDMLRRYDTWRERALAVEDAYDRWSNADTDEKVWWFSVYLGALDQEQAAAASYALVVRDIERWLGRA